MEWSKVKNVLIVLFFCANVLLLAFYLLRQYSDQAVARAAGENLRLALTKQGVTAELDFTDERAYTLSVRRVSSAEQTLAGLLLQNPQASDIGGGIVEYKGQTGQARFRSGGLFDALPDVFFAAPPNTTDMDTPMQFLDTLGFQVWPDTLSLRVSGTEITAQALACLEDRPVFNGGIYLRYAEGRLTDVSGRWIWGETYRAGALCRTAGEILLRFCAQRRKEGAPVSQVTAMTLGYAAVRSQTEGFTDFVPVWKCTADGEEYFLNGETGQIQNIEN